jgi:hypothetical protein
MSNYKKKKGNYKRKKGGWMFVFQLKYEEKPAVVKEVEEAQKRKVLEGVRIVKPEIEMVVREASRQCKELYNSKALQNHLDKEKDAIMVALREASNPNNIKDARVFHDGSVWSMKVLLKGEEKILTVKTNRNSLELMLTDKNDRMVEYLMQKENTLYVEGRGAKVIHAYA